MKVLFVGFSSFANHKENPSATLAKEFEEGKGYKGIVLPVSYAKAKEMFLETYRKYKPDYVLIFNLSPFTNVPVLEQYAYNEMKADIPDNDGVYKNGEVVVENGLKSITSTVDPGCIEQYLASSGYPSRLGLDPGRFVCNEIYYLSLCKNTNSILVHIPLEGNEDLKEVAKLMMDYMDGLN